MPKRVFNNQLYRYFSAEGNLLYVGVSVSAILRLTQHRQRNAVWLRDVAHVDIENYPSRAEALAAERKAIKEEKPLHNVTYNRPPKPPKPKKLSPRQEANIRLLKAIFEGPTPNV